MAKGGLVGTADSTLVQGAFRLGRSNMPYNLGAVYQQRAANMKMFGEAVKGFMDNLYADHINTENNMNALAESIQEGGGLTNTYMIEQNNAVVNEFKERLKSIPKGKKGELDRQLLYQEMSGYAQSLNGSNEMYNNMVANAANKRLLSSYNSDEKKLFNLIMDDHVNGTANTQATYDRDKHEMVYSMQNEKGETITMSMADINRGLAAYDPTYLSNIASKFTNVVNYAKQSKNGQMTTNDAIRLKNDLNKSITSWPEIRNVAKEKFGNMKHSFEEVLMGQATDASGNIDTSLTDVLYNELEAAGGIDMDGNNIVNEADRKIYTNPKNAGLLIDALHKDKEKYKELMTGFLTETVVNDYYQQGVDQRPKEEIETDKSNQASKYGGYAYASDTGGDAVSGQSGFTQVPYSDKIARRSALINLDNVPGLHFEYRYNENDGWQAFDKNTNEFARNLKGSDIARIEGLFSLDDANSQRSFSYFNAKSTKRRKEDLPPADSSGISVSALKVRNAGDFKQNILNIFNPEILDDYTFEDVTRVTEFGTSRVQDQVRVKSKDGSFDKIFNIGKKANEKLAIELNNLFSDYLAVDPFIIN